MIDLLKKSYKLTTEDKIVNLKKKFQPCQNKISNSNSQSTIVSMTDEDQIFLNAMGIFQKSNIANNKTFTNKQNIKEVDNNSTINNITNINDVYNNNTIISNNLVNQEDIESWETFINAKAEISLDKKSTKNINTSTTTAIRSLLFKQNGKNNLQLTQTKINLAAGISIPVDYSINLSRHTEIDAIERLKECILNGHTLGWQNMHVQFEAPEEMQKRIITKILDSPAGKHIVQYANAPIPMGGPDAWILYYQTDNFFRQSIMR